MNQITRSWLRITILALALAMFVATASAQPTPVRTAPGGANAPAPSGPPSPMLSPVLSGIISQEEYAKFTAFQQQLNDDPTIKALNASITGHIKALQQLQTEVHAAREKLIAANPDIKAIRDKMMSAGRAGAGSAQIPVPVPAKSK